MDVGKAPGDGKENTEFKGHKFCPTDIPANSEFPRLPNTIEDYTDAYGVEVSTQKLMSWGGGGYDNNEPQKSSESLWFHHSMLLITLEFGVFLVNGDVEG